MTTTTTTAAPSTATTTTGMTSMIWSLLSPASNSTWTAIKQSFFSSLSSSHVVQPHTQAPSPPSSALSRYIMPAESEPHSHTLMAFPSIRSADTEVDLACLQREVCAIANAISEFEPVHLFARPDQVSKAMAMVTGSSNVHVKPAAADQLWIRDSGPIYVRDATNPSSSTSTTDTPEDDKPQEEQKGTRTAISFNFNYWGNKLPPTGDQNLALEIAQSANDPFLRSPKLTLEGGAIEHDGQGTFLGSESCILNPNRNPDLTTKPAIESELTRLLGFQNFIWIPGVKDIDITDYHIDAIARFVRPGVILLSKPHPNARKIEIEAYRQTLAILSSPDLIIHNNNKKITLLECEEPDPTLLGPPDTANECVASYVNYYLVNDGGCVMPKFGQKLHDDAALELFRHTVFPGRKVVQVELNMLPRTGGGIHCATQQVPA